MSVLSRKRKFARWLLLLLAGASVLSAGCASRPVMQPPGSTEQACLDFYQAVDRAVEEHGVRDGAAPPVPGYPFLRQDRELASFAADARNDTLEQLHALDRQARRWELANLPRPARRSLALPAAQDQAVQDALDRCGGLLLAAVLRSDSPGGEELAALARPGDEYIGWHRVAGVYPISRWFIRAGVARWQQGVRDDFAAMPPERPAELRYQPALAESAATPSQLAGLVESAPRDAFDRPMPSRAQMQLLLAAYAPVIEIERDETHNRLGTPAWMDQELPGVLVDEPRVYHYVDHARFGGRGVLRLNYVFWFSARPRDHFLDLLGGRLDGMTVRWTLGPDGMPLLLETMHNCGCYHQHYPFRPLRPLERADYAEPPLVLPAPALPGSGQRLTLSLEDGTHYVKAVYLSGATESHARDYLLEAYDRLRSLEWNTEGGGRRSLFGGDGLVRGTERRERWLFWVSGVPEPGAMRQRGRHATAFVGKRHFDDPDLLDRIYHAPWRNGDGRAP
ncbi:MAG: hypothetical protein JJU06_10680 [Ectothiorhodospiraceae bacterium]|nr:hypothetical protein [Ectothiorhodospiraceae bacterium]